MDDYESKLKQFISENNIKAEHIIFEQTCHTVKDAAEAVGTNESNFIKSVVFLSGNETIIGIVLGNYRASSSRLKKHTGLEIEVATPEQVLKATGYPVGGVPPFGYKAQFFLDQKVMDKEEVYGGGGSPRALTKITPKEIRRVTNAEIIRVRK